MSMAGVRLALEEVAIALDCALAAGERPAGHQIIPSTSFDSLLEHLRSAQAAVDEARAATEHEEMQILQFPEEKRLIGHRSKP
jgi:hypothetical protein